MMLAYSKSGGSVNVGSARVRARTETLQTEIWTTSAFAIVINIIDAGLADA